MYIDGQLNSRIRILNSLNNQTNVFDLPMCNQNGYSEEKEEISVIHEVLYPHCIYKKVFGYWVTFNLDYSQYIDGSDLLNIQTIQDYERDGYTLELTPNIDNPLRRFIVYISSNTIRTEPVTDYKGTIANKITGGLQFKTKFMVSTANWVDPNLIQYAVRYNHPRTFVMNS